MSFKASASNLVNMMVQLVEMDDVSHLFDEQGSDACSNFKCDWESDFSLDRGLTFTRVC